MARVIINIPFAKRVSQQATFRHVRTILREIRIRARIVAAHGPYTSGRLAESIDIIGPFIEVDRVRGSVGSDLHYAELVNSGAGLYGPKASKYLIRPRPPKRYLRFYWRRMGRTVALERVRHPGQRGKRYLTDALREVARRHNLRVIIRE